MKHTFYINASMLSKGACMMRIIRTIVDGYKSRADYNYNDTTFGSAWHKYRETLLQTHGDHLKALLAANECWTKKNPITRNKKDYIDIGFLNRALSIFNTRYGAYWDRVEGFQPIFIENKVMVEQQFAIPVYTSDTFDLVLSGTIDRIGRVNEALVIEDDKTTTGKGGPNFMTSFEASVQFRLYFYVFNAIRKLMPDSPMGKIFGEYENLGVRIFQVSYGPNNIDMDVSGIFSYNEREQKMFEVELEHKLRSIINAIKSYLTGTAPAREGFANGACKEWLFVCPFNPACSAESDEMEATYLEQYFERKPYEPLKHI